MKKLFEKFVAEYKPVATTDMGLLAVRFREYLQGLKKPNGLRKFSKLPWTPNKHVIRIWLDDLRMEQ